MLHELINELLRSRMDYLTGFKGVVTQQKQMYYIIYYIPQTEFEGGI